MKNLVLSILLSLFPIFSFTAWVITVNNKLLSDHSERLNAYKKIIFNLKWDFKILNVLNLILIAISLMFAIKYFNNNHLLLKKIAVIIFILFLALLMFFNFWGLL